MGCSQSDAANGSIKSTLTPEYISCQDLSACLADYHIIDCSFSVNGAYDPAARYKESHIPGAHFVEMKQLSDSESPYPFMMPTRD
jgi:thiosulfate/3-mercaptopyruvate sulfurtransferase